MITKNIKDAMQEQYNTVINKKIEAKFNENNLEKKILAIVSKKIMPKGKRKRKRKVINPENKGVKI